MVVDAAFCAGQNKDGVQYAGRALARGVGARIPDQRIAAGSQESSGTYLLRLCEDLTAILRRGDRFVCVGGDHSVGLASVVAVRSVIPAAKVLWIDAHADIHTWQTSLTKNLHGMPLGLACHGGATHPAGDLGWVRPGLLSPVDLGYIGLRDVDAPEWQAIADCFILDAPTCQTMSGAALAAATRAWAGDAPLHLSVDVDVLDPTAFTATGYNIPGGLVLDQLRELLDGLLGQARIVSCDLVEYNPIFDLDGTDAAICQDLLRRLAIADHAACLQNDGS